MWQQTEQDSSGDELFLAGERVLPGLYRQINGRREIRLETEDILPASLDGQVACYMRVHRTWAQMSHQETAMV